MEDGGKRDEEDEDGEGRGKKTSSVRVPILVRVSWAKTQTSEVSEEFPKCKG